MTIGTELRRIPLSRRSHIIGFQPLATGTVQHESALERDFVILTSFLDPTACITSQPVTLRFSADGVLRRYTPDFLVCSAGSARLVEVKYRADLLAQWKQLRPSFTAARAWAREQGASFGVATERAIRGAPLENAKRLLPLVDAPLNVDLQRRVCAAIRNVGSPTFGEVLTSLPQERQAILATLWRLIARRAVLADLSLPITLDTRLSLP